MVDSKKTLPKIILFLFLIIFPFGQLFRFNLNLLSQSITVQPIDLIAGLSLIYLLFKKTDKPGIYKILKGIFVYLTFSLFISLAIFNFKTGILGIFYFIRLLFYTSLFLLVYDLVKSKNNLKDIIYNSLIVILVFVGIFGWIQYFLYPDLRSFIIWGWDDHLFRLVGTFLDPGFTSIFLVFGFLLSLDRYLQTKNRFLLLLLIFFFITLGLTYSRAGYLSLLAGISTMLIIKKRIKWFVVLIIALGIMIFLLPRPSSEGVKLERAFSILLRLKNYKETIVIWQNSPLFGVGYNNLCFARNKFIGEANYLSHSCSGSDSSILALIATTGILGFIFFIEFIKKVVLSIDFKSFGTPFLACSTALFIHSLFVNSLFYAWVMGIMAILLGLSLKEFRKKTLK
ncbi:hypothetical protein A2V55_00055 [Candidatus Woesebacteria bacterium RBG_19FT_COMBO_37_29]|uniref:O-antigen ligase-related domain-containing protein n=1 Tax=Candidatus Woesebacteria bacterium RBG_19FT_COMBO_37_29 TaxID=1802486 RepID=A0A1F7XNJ6_9BACT|nr:MAG: hypothetical protein A2V55_00055 [Candidatus Woesebacteria bacterium RBG_19FT_COMBO_37_29]